MADTPKQPSALERLLKKPVAAPTTSEPAAAAAPPAQAAPAAPVTPPVATATPAPPTPASPAPAAQQAAPEAPSLPSAPAMTADTAHALMTPDLIAKVKAMSAEERHALMVKDSDSLTDEEVAQICIMQYRLDGAEVQTVADAAAAAHTGGFASGISMPFARLKENWEASKGSMTEQQYEHMPVGKRPYTAIYLGVRLGGTVWEGEPPSKGVQGKPPKASFVLHTPMGDPLNGVLRNKRLLECAAGVQFAGKANHYIYKDVGRLACSAHILCWSPQVGYHLLVLDQYDPANSFIETFGDKVKQVGSPFTFSIKEDQRKKKNPQPGDKFTEWIVRYPVAELAVNEIGKGLLEAFKAEGMKDVRAQMRVRQRFDNGQDFDGENRLEVIDQLFDAYEELNKLVPSRRSFNNAVATT
jgi:hypothetical protein